MANNISSKIYKLLKAFGVRGDIYLLNHEQVWSDKLQKPCNLYKLYHRYNLADYLKINPDYKPKKNQMYVKKMVCDSFKQIDILLTLVDAYKAGDKNEKEERKCT